MSEIKPCMCGRTPMLVSTSPTMIRVNCNCGKSTAWVSTQEQAIQQWNALATMPTMEEIEA
jgi:hypothetical protein